MVLHGVPLLSLDAEEAEATGAGELHNGISPEEVDGRGHACDHGLSPHLGRESLDQVGLGGLGKKVKGGLWEVQLHHALWRQPVEPPLPQLGGDAVDDVMPEQLGDRPTDVGSLQTRAAGNV